MNRESNTFIAGHQGLVGSAILRTLQRRGHSKLLLASHADLDLTRQSEVEKFFRTERPEKVYLAAAKVGGILANNSYPADFIYNNLAIEMNVIDSAYRSGVKRLLFLGSSCIYPKFAAQPIEEDSLLSGALEPTNRPYALAKIAGIEMCWSYNRQFGTTYLAVMPTNLYGPGDNYDPDSSHVIPSLIRKMHEAKTHGQKTVVVWGSGTPKREFLYSEDLADACVHLMGLDDKIFHRLIDSSDTPPIINVGCGADLTVRELAILIADVVGFTGEIVFDTSKPDGTPRKLLNVDRLGSLGWRPKFDLRQGMELAYEDFVHRYVQPTRFCAAVQAASAAGSPGR
jgi:GDP-L-fucose synthase